MNWCLIIPIITGVICAILGYLLGKLLSGGNTSELDEWKSKYISLEKDLAKCRSELTVAKSNAETSAAFAAAAVIPFDAALAKSVFGKSIKENDLKVVEGIGPEIEKLFHKHGIKTWKDLSETTVARCQEILDSEGERFVVHDPETWHEQARLAYEGKWKKLLEWQDKLDGGRL
ncbi:hypothetical protein [Robertkochia solimangrovi]|uniref:hypothetical protein n=1 Tax=Robertkochia solimangrovi TaxID=2213046 RepID=UPI00117F6416|nr:hypothetical protein [Robertkochia solimangrovi]TRZ45886.1 hypothetical protein DMZ48_01010 [Robertkochia solimangrovi]